MLARFRARRPSHATVVAYLALFVAVSTGGAYAANTVFSTDIVDGEVKTPDLASGAVNGAKVADNSLSGTDVIGKPGTGTAAAVNGSLTTDDIAGQQANAANGTPFIDGTLTQWDIKNGSVTGRDVVESSLAKVPDADKLDGLDSAQLSPASADGRTADLALNSPFEPETVLSANITTARPASLLATAAVDISHLGTSAAVVECWLRFDDTTSSPIYGTTVPGQSVDTLPLVWAQGVGAGTHTVELRCTGPTDLIVDNAGMSVSAHL
jgi:hypothetical protein